MKKVFASVLLISGSAWLCWGFYFYFRSLDAQDPKYHIVAIVQTGLEKEALKSSYLAELLDLSVDRPVNIYKFRVDVGAQKLLSCPLIKKAHLKKIPPGTLFIDYEIRKPVAYIADLANTAVDSEGFLIPFKPFYSPKNLPKIVLGLVKESLSWGERLRCRELEFALNIFRQFSDRLAAENLYLDKVDVSRLNAPSLGQQQILLVLHEKRNGIQACTTLILGIDNMTIGLQRYLALRKLLNLTDSQVVDLRLGELGYLYSDSFQKGPLSKSNMSI